MAERRGRGRPAFKPTPLMRRSVEQYVCCGMSHDEVADVLGISDETLRKHFAAELKFGARKKRAEIIQMLFATARKGNVSAQKKLEEMSRVAVAEETLAARDADAPMQKPVKLGKKEAAAQEAETAGAGTAWGDDLRIGIGGRTLN